jgi:hypothetical protein
VFRKKSIANSLHSTMPTLFNFRVLLLGAVLLHLLTCTPCLGLSIPHRKSYDIIASSHCTSCTISTTTSLSSKLSAHFVSTGDDDQMIQQPNRLRDNLRQVTGFSLTACRATWRAATGISFTAIYASSLAFTGLWVRKFMSSVLSIFPAWVRGFPSYVTSGISYT